LSWRDPPSRLEWVVGAVMLVSLVVVIVVVVSLVAS